MGGVQGWRFSPPDIEGYTLLARFRCAPFHFGLVLNQVLPLQRDGTQAVRFDFERHVQQVVIVMYCVQPRNLDNLRLVEVLFGGHRMWCRRRACGTWLPRRRREQRVRDRKIAGCSYTLRAR